MGIAAAGVFLWWATQDGGYAPTAWYSGALFLLLLLGGLIVFRPAAPPTGEWMRAAIVLFAAFTIWSFLSIAWAGVQGDAWDGANRTLLYLTVYSTFALLGWQTRDGALFLALFAVGTAVIGATEFTVEGTSAFTDGRLAVPIGYANASAALFFIAFWPAVSLAARPEVHWAARSVLLAAAGVLLQLAILAQSRGSMVAGAVALAVYVLLSKQRLRAVLMLLPVAAVTLTALDPILSVFASGTESGLHEAVGREQQALVLSAAALLALGFVIALLDRRDGLKRGRHLRAGRPRVVALATVAAAALLAGAVVTGLSPDSGPTEGGDPTSAVRSSRFGGGIETGRFDMWRVAAQSVADHPLLGVGADNFAVDFARERETHEEPLYPHSLVLRAFSQTGLVGGALFLGFTGAALLAAIRVGRRADAFTQAVAAASIASAVYWLVHGSLDWLWEIPVLAAPALAFLALASGLGRPQSGRALAEPRRSRVRWATAVLSAAAAASYLLPGAAAWQLERAVGAWPAEPQRTFSRLDWARRLNPLSERADIVAGTLARRVGQPDRARSAFEHAVGRNPADWYVHLQLALLYGAAGGRGAALAEIARAEALNPLEATIHAAKQQLLAEEVVSRPLALRIDGLAIRSPLGRRPIDCTPVLGIASSCG